MKLHVEKLGDGPPLIVLHGLLGSGDNWLGLAKNWAPLYTILAPDLRNHGRSPHSAQTGFADMAQDVAELIYEHGFTEATVLGHSLGGKVAMQLAMDHPSLVSGLLVVDIAPRQYAPVHEAIVRALLAIELSQHATRSSVEQELAAAVTSAPVRQWLLKNLGRNADTGFFWKPNLPILLQELAALSAALPVRAGYSGPVQFVRGGRSEYISAEDAGNFSQWFSGAELVTIPEAGHWVHVDAPQELDRLVKEFMARLH